MAKIKYYYDTETCKYERWKISKWDFIINTLAFLLVSLVFSAGIFWVYTSFWGNSKEKFQAREIEELRTYVELANSELDILSKKIVALEAKDDNIYRVIFEAKPIHHAKGSFTDMYKNILTKDLNTDELLSITTEKMKNLERHMKIQNKSYNDLLVLAKNKSKMLASIPAIQPIKNKELTKLASGFGMRIHPIYKVKKMHTGVDFAALKGTPVYATGDGTVQLVASHPGGYGNEIEINHGFGYVTKYAHLDGFAVKQGQKIKRGELIGYIGNTGSSTAPHLHYEVIYKDKKVDPVHYFFNDLSPGEYERILELASIENQSLS